MNTFLAFAVFLVSIFIQIQELDLKEKRKKIIDCQNLNKI